jgi:hypothetical protein
METGNISMLKQYVFIFLWKCKQSKSIVFFYYLNSIFSVKQTIEIDQLSQNRKRKNNYFQVSIKLNQNYQITKPTIEISYF